MHLSNEDVSIFLSQLQTLFTSRHAKGSVFITQKRFSYVDPTADVDMNGAAMGEDKEWPCLIRATDGKEKASKTKLATIVQPSDYHTFSIAYGTLLKANMTTMRPKKKTKRKGDAKKGGKDGKSAVFSLTKVIGPKRGLAKRGAGVEKRRTLIKRREKELKKVWARKRREEAANAHAGVGTS